MRGDYSRLRFRPRDHYSGVRLQQGRVQLDADWNEQIDIDAYRDEQTALDVIGPSGFPFEGGGFQLATGWYLRGVSFHAELQGVAVGEDAAILTTTDGGASWSLADPPQSTRHLNGVHALAEEDVWAVGDAGAILHFGAGSWSVQTGTTGANLNAVFFADQSSGWAVGEDAVVLRHDGGWTVQAVPDTTADLYDVAAVSPSRAWIVGAGATIIARTADDSAWASQQAPADTGDLFGVWFLLDGGVERGWAVGAGGTILATADGGATWAEQSAPSGVSATLRDVRFFDPQSGLIAGDDGTILFTSDGGATWNAVPFPADAAGLRSVCIVGPQAHVAGDGIVLNGDVSLQSWTEGELPDPGRTLTIAAGDGYVEGVRACNERRVSFSGQADAPGARLPDVPGAYAAYLRVAEHHVTAVDREELREVALGGPDTATRTQTAWSVVLREMEVNGTPSCITAEATKPDGGSSGRLRARSELGEETSQECMVPIGHGYRRLENQLYRVEILDVPPSNGGDEVVVNGNGDGGAPAVTFTWSRDNGSVAMRLVALDGANNAVTVADIPDDEVLGLAPEQWIEISDDTRALRGERGLVAQIKSIEGDVVVVEGFEAERPGGGDWTTADFPLRPTVRRWDGRESIDPETDWQPLEAGVEVQFDGASYRPGDYWTIPARTLAGDVEWRHSGRVPLFEEPHGELLRWATLGVVERDDNGTWTTLSDCRRLFPPLTGLVHFYYVSGDGQETMPNVGAPAPHYVALDAPLQVGVSNWRWPVEGASVQFEVVAGDGRLNGTTNATVTVETGGEGIAECEWYLNGDIANLLTQQVRATLRDENGDEMQTPIVFNANLSVAAEVAYDGDRCGTLEDDTTVQAAITKLSRLTRLFPLSGTGIDVGPGQAGEAPLPLEVIVLSECGPVTGATVEFTPPADSGTASPPTATTNAQGRATTSWTLNPQSPTQLLTATLTDPGAANVRHLPDQVVFVANLNLASDTAYTPTCAALGSADNVQEAIDALATLPRLFHVTGDGAHTAPTQRVDLEVGVASDCGADHNDRVVRFLVRDGDGTLEDIDRDGNVATSAGRAKCAYRMGIATRHVVEAQLIREGTEIYEPPVVFTITRVNATEVGYSPGCELLAQAEVDNVQDAITALCKQLRPPAPSLSLRLERDVLNNVDDTAGVWQYEGGRAFDTSGKRVGEYASTKRIISRATDAQNTAMLTMTIFFVGSSPPESITVQGSHDFNSGRQKGSVSAASAARAAFIGHNFTRVGDTVNLGEAKS